jgi:uncharacterized protein (TIGR03435 family)
VSAGISLLSQSPPPQKRTFEVASVKQNKSGDPPGRMGTEGDRFIAENYPVVLLIRRAYGFPAEWLSNKQLIGGPAWIRTDRFDIEAKVEGDMRTIPAEQAWLMVQSLLEDRFQLRAHRETRQLPVYNLLVARNGIKMKLSGDQSLPHRDDEDDQPNIRFDPSAPPVRGETGVAYTPRGDMILAGRAVPISPNLAIRRPHSLPPTEFDDSAVGKCRESGNR